MDNNRSTTRAKTPSQFSLALLLLLVAVFAVSLIPIVWWGVTAVPVSCWAFALGMAVVLKQLRPALAIAFFGLPLLLITPMFQAPRGPHVYPQCRHHLRNIAVAILNYETFHGHFPPPYSTDEDGRPLHSWRVLILPYLEETALYEAIDLSKPWNHPDNLKLASRMPDVFRCPDDKSLLSVQTTTYAAVVGKNTVWQSAEPVKVNDISDGMSKTLLVVESTSSRTHWMAPLDPMFESIVPVAKDGRTLILSSPHEGNLSNSAFCDGHVKSLDLGLSADKLRALWTIDGYD